jgi:hypothetical protein
MLSLEDDYVIVCPSGVNKGRILLFPLSEKCYRLFPANSTLLKLAQSSIVQLLSSYTSSELRKTFCLQPLRVYDEWSTTHEHLGPVWHHSYRSSGTPLHVDLLQVANDIMSA